MIMNRPGPTFTHGPDMVKLLLALWLFASPWMLNYNQVRAAVWNGNVVAMIVAVFTIASILKFTTWEEWITIVAGLWLFASPAFLDYTPSFPSKVPFAAATNHLTVGLMLMALSFWQLNLWELIRRKIRAEP
jgi:SPW repeat